MDTAGPQAGAERRLARPWAQVPRSVADSLRPALPATIAHVIETVTAEVAAYSGGEPRVAGNLSLGVDQALSRLIDLMGTDEAALDASAELYEQIGAGEYRAGRGLADLLSAYRIGARASWQSMSRAGVAAGVSPADVARLAEAVFAYIDELSAASLAGYARAQLADAGRREQARSELVNRILAGDAASERVQQLSDEVGWPLPATVVVVVPRGEALPEPIPGGVVGRLPSGPVALVGGPVNRPLRAWLRAADPPVAVGLELPLGAAAQSLDQARTLAAVPGPGSLVGDEHTADLVLAADPVAGAALRARTLAPFDALPEGRRDPLLETLRSWLLHAGNRPDVGADLHVHPQTVSYRMDRIRELVPGALDDPEQRWLLLLALMVPRTGRPGTGPRGTSVG
jgi:hypothetical protein